MVAKSMVVYNSGGRSGDGSVGSEMRYRLSPLAWNINKGSVINETIRFRRDCASPLLSVLFCNPWTKKLVKAEAELLSAIFDSEEVSLGFITLKTCPIAMYKSDGTRD